MTKTKSALLSKINWTQSIGFLAMIATLFNVNIAPEDQAQIAGAIVGVQGAVTIILRTFFTRNRLTTTVD